MPLVGRVGRKRARARLAMTFLYLILTIGAITTVYPFATMLATGFKSTFDQDEASLLPIYWRDLNRLTDKYRDDKYAGNAVLIESFAHTPEGSAELDPEFEQFLESLPPDMWLAGFKTPSTNVTSRLNVEYQTFLRKKYGTVRKVNNAYNEISGAFQQIVPPPERLEDPAWQPREDQKWRDWQEFKRDLPAEFRVPITTERLWQDFIKSKLANQFGDLPAELRSPGVETFEELPLPDPKAHPLAAEFFEKGIPERFRQAGTIEEQWHRFLASRNLGVTEYRLPISGYEQRFVQQDAADIRREFTWRNYAYVIDYVAVNGRALINTVIFCALTILLQLTVNPIAAYALSRYPMRATGRILLFLLATMAFPAEVAMIPSFLLLKDLGLLNTFAALVLPAAASGYMIFLLKGFFDSLPQEVFESAQIDGAPEWLMMLKIAFPLSKPVMGYMALLAFMGAYGAFIYAFLVAQDRQMWTLMVFIYQLQLSAPKAMVMAAVTLAALPTLAVFLLAQNVIMRGIVLPGER